MKNTIVTAVSISTLAYFYRRKKHKSSVDFIRVPFSKGAFIAKSCEYDDIVRYSYDEQTISQLLQNVDTVEHLGVDICIDPTIINGNFSQIIFPNEISSELCIYATILAEDENGHIEHLKRVNLSQSLPVEQRTFTHEDLNEYAEKCNHGVLPKKLIVKIYATDDNKSYIMIGKSLSYDDAFIIDFIGNDKTKLNAQFWGMIGIKGQTSEEFNVAVNL